MCMCAGKSGGGRENVICITISIRCSVFPGAIFVILELLGQQKKEEKSHFKLPLPSHHLQEISDE